MSKEGGLYLSEDQAFLASLALPRSPLAGAVFAGHHLWWKGKDTTTENKTVNDAFEAKEGDPQKTIFLQYGASTALSGLTKGLDAEMAWSSGHDLQQDQASYFKIKKIGNNSDVKAQMEYYKNIFEQVIPDIQTAADASLFTANKLAEEYIPRDEEIENVIKHLIPDKTGVSPIKKKTNTLVKNFDAGLAMDQEGLLEFLADITSKSGKALTGAGKYGQTLKVLPLITPLPVEESKEALKEYKDAIKELQTKLNGLEKKHTSELATLVDKLRDLEETLGTEVENVRRATKKWKELSARFNEYRLESIQKRKDATEKVRQEKKEALAMVKKHSDTLELLEACQERLASLETKRQEAHKISADALQEEQGKLETQRTTLEAEIEQLKSKISAESSKGDAKLNQQKENLEKIIQELTATAEANQVNHDKETAHLKSTIQKDAKTLETAKGDLLLMKNHNIELINLNAGLEKERDILAAEVVQDHAAAKALAAEVLAETNQNKAAAITIKHAKDDVDVLKTQVEESKGGPKPIGDVPMSWIAPQSKEDAIESVFHLDQRIQKKIIDMSLLGTKASRTVWSLILDRTGKWKGFGNVKSARKYMGRVLTAPFPADLGPAPKSPTDQEPTEYTTPGIFYSLKGKVKLHILIPSRFIPPKGKGKGGYKWPGGLTGAHLLIGFSVYLEIFRKDKSTIRFFTNVESKSIVTAKLTAGKFQPTYMFLQIGTERISTSGSRNLVGATVAYSGKEAAILEAMKNTEAWVKVKAHVTRVYLHGVTPQNQWESERDEVWDVPDSQTGKKDKDKKKYGAAEKLLQDWLNKNKNNLSFVTDTNLTGIERPKEIKAQTEFPSDSGKWLRQTSFAATPEFW